MAEDDHLVVEQKEKLLAQHRRNLSYLEQQAAQYGSEAPLSLHNALTAEHEAVRTLEKELASLGIAPRPEPSWQALVIDADTHWREIIANHIDQFGGTVIECNTIPTKDQREIIESSSFAIVGASGYTKMEAPAQAWIDGVVTLARKLPIILLASWEERDVTIALRHAIRNDDPEITSTTIFKETFNQHWFSRIVHQFLIR